MGKKMELTNYNVFKFLYYVAGGTIDDDYVPSLTEVFPDESFCPAINDFYNFLKTNYERLFDSVLSFLDVKFLKEEFADAYDENDDTPCMWAEGITLACMIDEQTNSRLGCYLYADMLVRTGNEDAWEYIQNHFAESFDAESLDAYLDELGLEMEILSEDDVKACFAECKERVD